MLTTRWLGAAVLPFLAFSIHLQDPRPVAAEARTLADRYLADVGGEAGRRAVQQLSALVERDYAGVFTAWRDERPGKRRVCLEHMLQIPAIRAATAIAFGSVAGTERIQGGVIDYHTLVVEFANLELLRGADVVDADRGDSTLVLLRGTSRDAWLAKQLAQSLTRIDGARVWLLSERRLEEPAADGRAPRALVIHEWVTLPAGALASVRALLRG